MIGSRVARDSCAQRGNRDLGRFVAIDVNVKLQSGLVIGSHNVIELARRNVPDSVRVAVVIAWPFDAGCECLDRAIGHQLHGAEAQLWVVELLPCTDELHSRTGSDAQADKCGDNAQWKVRSPSARPQ